MTDDRKVAGTTDGHLERAKDQALGKHDDHPGVADHVGEAAGGISGVLAGAAIGSVAGPIGTVIGGIAGAMGGWWTGRAIAEAATAITGADDEHYRRHYETAPNRPADRRYEEVQPAYHLGHIAAHNPNFTARTFAEVEPELRRGWSDEARTRHGDWDAVRGYVSEGYQRGRSMRPGTGVGATSSDVAPSRSVDRLDTAAADASGLRPEGDRT